jgi:hypothetical protein
MGAAAFLAGPLPGFTSGAIMRVDGGECRPEARALKLAPAFLPQEWSKLAVSLKKTASNR